MDSFIDLNVPCPGPDTLRPDAVVIEGRTHTGRPCRITDNTCSIPREDLIAVLEGLITERRFGMAALSAPGGHVLAIGQPHSTHIQFADTLYRLLLFPYEARIEVF